MFRKDEISRRRLLKDSAAAGAGITLGGHTLGAPMIQSAAGVEKPQLSGNNLYWGDIHNHNAVGYAKGSLERSYDIARSHLDFFCFTGHSQWHDMPTMPQNKHLKWVRGFEVMKNNWEKVKRLANKYSEPGKFVSFIGYEWHSSSYGDVCIIFPGSEAELVYIKDIKEFQRFARRRWWKFFLNMAMLSLMAALIVISATAWVVVILRTPCNGCGRKVSRPG
ncbi:MAG: twin-arginine translocation signal domain-containing protein [Planctomycetota bacterium]|jgi:hypothetical protein